MALNSLYGQLFTALQERIKTEVPEIRWVDTDIGQLELQGDGDRYAVSFPCVLIDFTGSQYSQLLHNIEMAEACPIQIRLGFAPFSNTNQLTPTLYKEKGLQYFEIENKLYKALKGWAPESGICQPLNRIADATEKREDALRVRSMIFDTSFEDATANSTFESQEADLSIEYENA